MPKPAITTFSSLAVNQSPTNKNNGFYAPRLTTAQKNAIPTNALRNGAIIYNTNSNKFEMYQNNNWIEIGTGNGNVTGPTSSTDNNIAVFNGASGQVIKDSSVLLTNIYHTTNSRFFNTTNNNYSYITPIPNINFGSGQNNVILATQVNLSSDPSYCIAIGRDVGIQSSSCVSIGMSNVSYSNTANSINIGNQSFIGSNSNGAVSIGVLANIGSDSADSINIGGQTDLKQNSAGAISIGHGAEIGENAANSVAIGKTAIIPDGVINTVALGSNSTGSASNGVFIGNRFLHMSNQTAPAASSGNGIFYVNNGSPVFNGAESFTGRIVTAKTGVSGGITAGSINASGLTAVTVFTTAVQENSIILVTRNTGTNPVDPSDQGHLTVGNISAGVSFKIRSNTAGDNSKVNWLIINPT